MRTTKTTAGLAGIPIALALVLTGCGGSSGGKAKANSTPDPAKAKSEITQTWESFFNKSTPVSQKVTLLQNGQAMQPAVAAFAKDPRVGQTTAKVSSVQVTGTSATVHYQISVNNQVMLPNAVGNAVYESGKWKVADQTLCGLLGLAGSAQKIPGCQ